MAAGAAPLAQPAPLVGRNDRTAWTVALALSVVAIAAVVHSARGRNAAPPPVMANAGNATSASTPAGTASGLPDLTTMTPQEAFSRLADRVQRAVEANDSAQVIQFFEMVEGAYNRIPVADRGVDERYHMGLLWAEIGKFPEASASVDTIFAKSPNNLLGWYLRAVASEFQGDSAATRAARAAFLKHFDSEIARKRPEYTEHRPLLDGFRQQAGGAP